MEWNLRDEIAEVIMECEGGVLDNLAAADRIMDLLERCEADEPTYKVEAR